MTGDPDARPGTSPEETGSVPTSGADGSADAPRVVRPTAARTRPEQTKDDTDEGWGDWRDAEDRDRWLLEQRPPHWG